MDTLPREILYEELKDPLYDKLITLLAGKGDNFTIGEIKSMVDEIYCEVIEKTLDQLINNHDWYIDSSPNGNLNQTSKQINDLIQNAKLTPDKFLRFEIDFRTGTAKMIISDVLSTPSGLNLQTIFSCDGFHADKLDEAIYSGLIECEKYYTVQGITKGDK